MPAASTQPLRVIPLGGLGEIGRNMMVYEYGDTMIAVDVGLMFPDVDHPGVDLIIPDWQYILDHKERLRAVFLTHGHEDHIGAVPFLLRDVNVPVFCLKLTRGLVQVGGRLEALATHDRAHANQLRNMAGEA